MTGRLAPGFSLVPDAVDPAALLPPPEVPGGGSGGRGDDEEEGEGGAGGAGAGNGYRKGLLLS